MRKYGARPNAESGIAATPAFSNRYSVKSASLAMEVSDATLRLAVGTEDCADLVADLERGFAARKAERVGGAA